MVESVSEIIENSTVNPLDRRPDHDQAVFIWIDILGFSYDLDNKDNYRLLRDTLKIFREIFDSKASYGITPISDGIVIDIPHSVHKYSYTEIVSLFQKVGECQFKFTLDTGLFTRGGIAVGTLNDDQSLSKESQHERVLISNGLARSHRIESRNVCWPIVGTTADYIDKLKSLFRVTRTSDIFKLSQTFNDKGEDVYFIDYLTKKSPLDQEYYQHILNGLNRACNPRVKSKYIWLLKHLNGSIGCNIPEKLRGMIL